MNFSLFSLILCFRSPLKCTSVDLKAGWENPWPPPPPSPPTPVWSSGSLGTKPTLKSQRKPSRASHSAFDGVFWSVKSSAIEAWSCKKSKRKQLTLMFVSNQIPFLPSAFLPSVFRIDVNLFTKKWGKNTKRNVTPQQQYCSKRLQAIILIN